MGKGRAIGSFPNGLKKVKFILVQKSGAAGFGSADYWPMTKLVAAM